jgi:hypothetical protein
MSSFNPFLIHRLGAGAALADLFAIDHPLN